MDKIEFLILSKWIQIVGTFFAQYSTPERISMFPNKTKYNDEINEIILHVNVNSAAAIEFQHFQNKILEKINSFLGYKAVHRIKIQQSLNLKNTAKFKKINTSEENFSNIKKIEIKDLLIDNLLIIILKIFTFEKWNYFSQIVLIM